MVSEALLEVEETARYLAPKENLGEGLVDRYLKVHD